LNDISWRSSLDLDVSGSREGSRLSDAINPVAALDRIGYILERTREPAFRVKAFRNAADAIRGLSDDELRELAASGRLRDLPGVGEKTERVIVQALAGERPSYLARLEKLTPNPDEGRGAEIRALLKGDCHTTRTGRMAVAPST